MPSAMDKWMWKAFLHSQEIAKEKAAADFELPEDEEEELSDVEEAEEYRKHKQREANELDRRYKLGRWSYE